MSKNKIPNATMTSMIRPTNSYHSDYVYWMQYSMELSRQLDMANNREQALIAQLSEALEHIRTSKRIELLSLTPPCVEVRLGFSDVFTSSMPIQSCIELHPNVYRQVCTKTGNSSRATPLPLWFTTSLLLYLSASRPIYFSTSLLL